MKGEEFMINEKEYVELEDALAWSQVCNYSPSLDGTIINPF